MYQYFSWVQRSDDSENQKIVMNRYWYELTFYDDVIRINCEANMEINMLEYGVKDQKYKMGASEYDIQTPVWLEDKRINDVTYCETFVQRHPLYYLENEGFRDVDGIISEGMIRSMIYRDISPYYKNNTYQHTNRLLKTLKDHVFQEVIPIEEYAIHFLNGTFNVKDNTFSEIREIALNPLPVVYNPNAPKPETWLRFINTLLYSEDIMCFQEFMGYLMIPSTRGESLLMLIGRGGEGKSIIKHVLFNMFGSNMTTYSLHRIESNNYSFGDLENRLVSVDDDMMLEQLRSSNKIKTIVTSKDKTAIEVKHSPSHQGRLYARLLGFGNGPLSALHDNTDGFYRRQLIMKVKNKNRISREDDRFLCDMLDNEMEGIVLWCLEGLRRLIENEFHFSVSDRMEKNRKEIMEEQNNIISFMESVGYIEYGVQTKTPSIRLYEAYVKWCKDNAEESQEMKTFCVYLKTHAERYNIKYVENIPQVGTNKRIRGYKGIRVVSEKADTLNEAYEAE